MERIPVTNCVCELCFPKANEICELLPEIWLFQDQEKWGLMMQPGHRGHELLYFPCKPWPDPDPDCISEDGESGNLADKWVDDIADFKVKMDPMDGHFLIEAAKANGYLKKDAGGKFVGMTGICGWLFNYAGQKLVELGE